MAHLSKLVETQKLTIKQLSFDKEQVLQNKHQLQKDFTYIEEKLQEQKEEVSKFESQNTGLTKHCKRLNE